MNKTARILGLCAIAFAATVNAQVTMAPLAGFGGPDGWLSPGEGGYTYLGTGSLERGLAYGNNHLYLVSRNGGSNIRILDKMTGADLGGLSVSGISGGTYAVNTVRVSANGVIYVNNLTTQSTTSPLKIYSWATEASTPTVAYSGNGGLAASRIGDSLALIGSGSSTRLAAGYNSNPSVVGNNGYAIIDPTTGTATQVAFAGTPPNAGDFRIGITFTDASHVWGTAGTTLRYTTFSGSAGSLLASYNPASNAERIMSFIELGGVPLLAVQSTGDSHVSVYDVTTPASPVLVASGNNTSGALTGNVNATGQSAWGDAVYNGDGTWSAKLWTMSSNQGIQAFIVTVPEPGALSILALGAAAIFLRRRTT